MPSNHLFAIIGSDGIGIGSIAGKTYEQILVS